MNKTKLYVVLDEKNASIVNSQYFKEFTPALSLAKTSAQMDIALSDPELTAEANETLFPVIEKYEDANGHPRTDTRGFAAFTKDGHMINSYTVQAIYLK